MNPKNTPDGYYKWVAAGVIWLIAALNYADRMTIFSVFPVLKHELGFSDITLALLGSTFLWTYAFCSPIGGYLGDRFSRRGIILTSLVLFSLVTFATGLVHSQVQLIGLRCLLGLSEAIFLPPALAYVAGFHSGKTLSLANSICLTGLTAGAGLGSWYGGYMTEHYSWRAGFFGLGVAGAITAVGAMIVLRKEPDTRRHSTINVHEPFWEKIRAVLSVRTAGALLFLAFALSLTSWPISSWVPTYLFENFHLSLTRAGSVITLYAALPALIGGIFGGVLADRWNRYDVRGRMAVQVIGFSVMAPTLFLLAWMSSARTVGLDLLIYSVARGMLECNSMPIICSVLPPHRWSMTYGLYNFAGTLAGSMGIFFVGVKKASWGIGYTLSAMSLLLFVALAVIALNMLRSLVSDVDRQRRIASS